MNRAKMRAFGVASGKLAAHAVIQKALSIISCP
jgi:hypothetical protein